MAWDRSTLDANWSSDETGRQIAIKGGSGDGARWELE